MRLILAITIVVMFLHISAFSQTRRSKGLISGKILDSSSSMGLSEAVVSVLALADSALVAFAIANANGEFEIKNLDLVSYRLLITFHGYQSVTYVSQLSATDPIHNLGRIHMQKKFDMLEEVIVEPPPIRLNKDTVEFNASAFKTKAHSTAEDLLKKLPGIQIDRAGNIQAQGQPVQTIYVDGKLFFHNDPKLALKNISVDMIESVQLYDDLSEQSKFTRIDDGSRQRTINLKLKKDRRNGRFGRAIVGGGPPGLYENSLNVNRFNDAQRVSILATANNVNKPGFSFNDILNATGGFGNIAKELSESDGGRLNFNSPGGAGNFQLSSTVNNNGIFGNNGESTGNIKSLSSGINYTDKWSRKTDAAGSYFFSRTERNGYQSSLRQTFFLHDSSVVRHQKSQYNSERTAHRFNFRIEHSIDSMNSIINAVSFNTQIAQNNNFDTITTDAIKPDIAYRILSGIILDDNHRNAFNFNNSLLFRKRMKKSGRTFTMGWNTITNQHDVIKRSFSPINFYQPDGTSQNTDIQHLLSTETIKLSNHSISSSYTERLVPEEYLN